MTRRAWHVAFLTAMMVNPSVAQNVVPMPAPAFPTPATGPEWLPRASIELQALDKVTARTTTLTGAVGQTLHFASLSIAVANCLVRPPDQRLDYAAWLDVTDAHPGGPSFHGWMLAAEPAASMMEHPLYDLRLTACRP